MKLREKINKELNEKFRDAIDMQLSLKYGQWHFKTAYNFMIGRVQTTWNEVMPKKMKKDVRIYSQGFGDGYAKAMNEVLKK